MSESNGAAKLYTSEVLALAVELANYPLKDAHALSGTARSQSCGSTLAISLAVNADREVEALGMQVSACVIGQASAAIFARHAKGRSAQDIDRHLAELEMWLADEDVLPDWPELSLIAPAKNYSARHGAILLPWRAAMQALSKA